jgi:hypothetical protein
LRVFTVTPELAAEVPKESVALTVKVYEVFGVSPLTVVLVPVLVTEDGPPVIV